jgi:hypothetical protein
MSLFHETTVAATRHMRMCSRQQTYISPSRPISYLILYDYVQFPQFKTLGLIKAVIRLIHKPLALNFSDLGFIQDFARVQW